MKLEKIIAKSRIVDLKSKDLAGALQELLDVSVGRFSDLKSEELLAGLLAREQTMTTYLGNGVALPHLRVRMGRRYILAIGRSRLGIEHDSGIEDEGIHIVLMLIADERARDYLQILAEIARIVKEPKLVHSLIEAESIDVLHHRIVSGFGGVFYQPIPAQQSKINRLMAKEAVRVARGADCNAVMVFGDAFSGGVDRALSFGDLKALLVTRKTVDGESQAPFTETIQVRSYSDQRLAQLRSALLVALTREVVGFKDRICCLGGVAGSNQFDTLVVVEVEREFQTLLSGQIDILPDDVKPEVLERVIAVATELAVEGREGRPVGCLFVVGATAKVDKLIKPLVLNPFYGYKEEDRNILNPFMDETIKEFSSIDGAFVIRGDGVVNSAGSLIQATDLEHPLPSGLGSRHAAAAAISVATDCIALVVSSSSGQVSLFRRGVMLPLTEKKMLSGS